MAGFLYLIKFKINKLVNKKDMKKKQYLEKLENLIMQRLKYHAPRVDDGEVDYALLDVVGIDAKYPVFLFKKPMNKIMFKAMKNVKKLASFNLVMFEKPLFKTKKIKNLSNTFLIFNEEMGGQLYSVLDKLNVNYVSKTDFNNKQQKEFIKINGQELKFDFLPYFYSKKIMQEGVIVETRQFLLNGKNISIDLLNTQNEKREINLEINIPLPRGYYSFKRQFDNIEIENLTTKEKVYFNYNLKSANFSFSNISGIESCTFACINLTCKITLLQGQKIKYFFNFGQEKFCISDNKLIDYFFEISQKKANQIFDIQVQSRDTEFDNMFNRCLPRKIWENWQNCVADEENINKWLKIKNDIVKSTAKGERISGNFKGLKEVKFYRNFRWNRVFILHNNSNYMYANKIKYFNYDLLTKEIFEKNSEIYLSFTNF